MDKTSSADIAAAIRSLRAKVQWKPGKGTRHLEKRKRRGHLPLMPLGKMGEILK